MSRFAKLFKKEKKSCRSCAHLKAGFIGIGGFDSTLRKSEWWNCKKNGSFIEKDELGTRFCQDYVRKKGG